ncbi:MAG: hypothetical protein CI953_1458 [Methanohalophilus sp.]|nr:MAG: hypothetical protein CI953_1458 [Methanohalophilus sp.]
MKRLTATLMAALMVLTVFAGVASAADTVEVRGSAKRIQLLVFLPRNMFHSRTPHLTFSPNLSWTMMTR